MTLNIDDVMEVLKIIKECKDTELHIDTGEMKLSIARGKVTGGGGGFFNPAAAAHPQAAEPATAAPATVAAAPVAGPANEPQGEAAPLVQAESGEVSEEGLVPVTANVTSVFYRKPSPNEPAFVEVGDEVQEDTVVCLLEVMKCFRQVLAGVKGRIEKICVESNSLVEEGTVILLIRPV
jgi:acetyl-CoA carboxylase biotin carboxyl carrier protein